MLGTRMGARVMLHGARALVGLGLVAVTSACTFGSGAPMDADTGTTASASSGAPGASTSTGAATTTGTGTDSGQASSDSTTAAVDGSSGEPPPPVPPTCPDARSELDRPDDSLEPQVRVLYVIPSDTTDDAIDTSGSICNSVRATSCTRRARARTTRRGACTHPEASSSISAATTTSSKPTPTSRISRAARSSSPCRTPPCSRPGGSGYASPSAARRSFASSPWKWCSPVSTRGA
jgi:hypothetical protein